MNVPLAPKFVVIDNFLSDSLVASLDNHVRADDQAMELRDFGGAPGEAYSALRKLWVHRDGLGSFEQEFCSAVVDRFGEICIGTGVAPFEIARIETEICAQRPGSFFARHIDTDTGDAGQSRSTDRLISAVFYFPREPLTFSGGELVLYDFTGRNPAERIAPRRNRLVAFPSFAYHEVTPLLADDDCFDSARWSVNCWMHRGRKSEAAPRPADR